MPPQRQQSQHRARSIPYSLQRMPNNTVHLPVNNAYVLLPRRRSSPSVVRPAASVVNVDRTSAAAGPSNVLAPPTVNPAPPVSVAGPSNGIQPSAQGNFVSAILNAPAHPDTASAAPVAPNNSYAMIPRLSPSQTVVHPRALAVNAVPQAPVNNAYVLLLRRRFNPPSTAVPPVAPNVNVAPPGPVSGPSNSVAPPAASIAPPASIAGPLIGVTISAHGILVPAFPYTPISSASQAAPVVPNNAHAPLPHCGPQPAIAGPSNGGAAPAVSVAPPASVPGPSNGVATSAVSVVPPAPAVGPLNGVATPSISSVPPAPVAGPLNGVVHPIVSSTPPPSITGPSNGVALPTATVAPPAPVADPSNGALPAHGNPVPAIQNEPVPPPTTPAAPVIPPIINGRLNFRRRAAPSTDNALLERTAEERVGALHTLNPTTTNFRFSARKYFLTYSRVGNLAIPDAPPGYTPPALQVMINSVNRPSMLEWAGVEETHQSGEKHWHVILIWDKPFRSRNGRIFNIGPLHPNIRCIDGEADLQAVWRYIHKDPNVVHFGTYCGPGPHPQRTPLYIAWNYILIANTEEEFWDRVRYLDPQRLACQYTQLRAYTDSRYGKLPRGNAIYEPRFTVFPMLTEEMRKWMTEEKSKVDRPKSLVLWGPSRTGKTEWARSLGPHSYMGSLFNLDEFDPRTSEYVIFDDLLPESLNLYTSYKAWFGAQRSFTATDKYRRKQVIDNWGRPLIWLSNTNPLDIEHWDKEFLVANSVIIHLEHRLY